MSKGSKWRKTDFRKYWDNWPKSMSQQKQTLGKITSDTSDFHKSLEDPKARVIVNVGGVLDLARKHPDFLKD